jgi:hypothetical protein
MSESKGVGTFERGYVMPLQQWQDRKRRQPPLLLLLLLLFVLLLLCPKRNPQNTKQPATSPKTSPPPPAPPESHPLDTHSLASASSARTDSNAALWSWCSAVSWT